MLEQISIECLSSPTRSQLVQCNTYVSLCAILLGKPNICFQAMTSSLSTEHVRRLEQIGFRLRPVGKCEAQPAAIVRVIAHAYANLPLQTRNGRMRTKRTLCRYMQRRPQWIGTAADSRAPTEQEYVRAQQLFPTLSFEGQAQEQEQQEEEEEEERREREEAEQQDQREREKQRKRERDERMQRKKEQRQQRRQQRRRRQREQEQRRGDEEEQHHQGQEEKPPASGVDALNALVRPCDIGSVERCCLLGMERCDSYAVLRFNEAKYGNLADARRLGEGGYGVVYLTRKGYVIKCSKSQDGEDVPQSDLREISILRNLVHPNVLAVNEVSLARTSTCNTKIIMPYYRQSFKDYLQETGRIVVPHVRARLLYQILRGVAFMHSRGVWHRDLKPANVLVDDQRLAIADFGLAEGVAIEGLPRNADVITMWWRPPEILLNSNYYGANADIWSVGVMWLDMLELSDLRGSNDYSQLRRIFLLLGRPEDHGWKAEAEALPEWTDYTDYEQSKGPEIRPLAERLQPLEHVTSQEIDLVRGLLAVNPKRRLNAFAALAHPFFDGVRDEVERAYPGPPLPTLKQVTCYDPLFAMELDPVGDYIVRHPRLNRRMIADLLDQLSHLNQHPSAFGGIHTWSVFAANVDILQRYMAKSDEVTRVELQNVGTTCYMIASKMVSDADLDAIITSQFTPGVTSRQVATIERKVLLKLDMDLDRPTVSTFWHAFTRDMIRTDIDVKKSQERLMGYLKMYEKSSQFRGSQLAYAALLSENVPKSDCMQRYERLYPQFFNDVVVRQINAS